MASFEQSTIDDDFILSKEDAPFCHAWWASRRLRKDGASPRRIEATRPPKHPNGYVFTPLQPGQIRLLLLLPGQGSDPISVQLFACRIEEVEGAYEALSYLWGTSQTRYEINCFGQVLQITPNLYTALQACRYDDYPRLFWIDQITINQDDDDEKGQQVQKMGSIYSKSASTLVWLSEDMWNDIEICDDLVLFCKFAMSALPVFAKERLSLDYGTVETKLSSPPERVWNAAFKILQNQYFTRLWMAQEICLAESCLIMVGQQMHSWDNLSIIATFFQTTLGQVTEFSTEADIPPGLLKYSHGWHKMRILRMRLRSPAVIQTHFYRYKWTVLDLLAMLSQQYSTDPRDYVYGCIGILQGRPHCVPPNISPAYDINNTLDALVESIFMNSLSKGDSLQTLRYCTPITPSDIPSWMGGMYTSFSSLEDLSLVNSHCSMRGLLPAVRVGAKPRSLYFRATAIVRVNTVGLSWPGWRSTKELYLCGTEHREGKFLNHVSIEQKALTLRDFVVACRDISFGTSPLLGASLAHFSSAFWRHVGAYLSLRDTSQDYQLQEEIIHSMLTGADLTLESGGKEKEVNRIWQSQSNTTMAFCCGDQITNGEGKDSAKSEQSSGELSTTHIPTMCWVPMEVEVGDLIYNIHGFELPMLVRKLADQSYRFLGPCFVYQYMNGEALVDDTRQAEELLVV